MSQKLTRKSHLGDDKDKGQSDTPVKEMKKKMAANAEKEKQAAAEKHAEKEKDKDKHSEKQPEKAEKTTEKTSEKKDKGEKSSDKKEKHAEKEKEKEKAEKSTEKKNETPVETPKEDKSTKPAEKSDEKDKKRMPDTPRPKQNGARTNGLPAADAHNGAEHSDATVSSDDEMVIDHERDDMFPELAYEDSDGEFEPPTPEGLPSRSYTRRSQAKATRTPETPRPASERRADAAPAAPPATPAAPAPAPATAADDVSAKEAKVLKLKEDTPTTDRKLRSSDSPKPESKKPEKAPEKTPEKKSTEKETSKVESTKAAEKSSPKKMDLEVPVQKDDEGNETTFVDVVIDLDGDETARSKRDTNYSRSRVRVSPYRRAPSSVRADYTGNNSTMEMDITESSSLLAEEAPPMDSPYLNGLRSIRGRRSYKPLKEMTLRNIGVSRSVRSTTSITVSEPPARPTAPVVGRKRKPEGEAADGGKRARLLQRLARPFRAAPAPAHPAPHTAHTPPARSEIVGINTDLPLTAPVASPDTFDPESLKVTSTPLASAPAIINPGPEQDRESKRCIVM